MLATMPLVYAVDRLIAIATEPMGSTDFQSALDNANAANKQAFYAYIVVTVVGILIAIAGIFFSYRVWKTGNTALETVQVIAKQDTTKLEKDLEVAKGETLKVKKDLEAEKQNTAAAQQKAAEAQQLAAGAWSRTLPRAYRMNGAKFADTIRDFPPSSVEILYKPNDEDAQLLAIIFEAILRKKNWKVSEPREFNESDDLKKVPANLSLAMRVGAGVDGLGVGLAVSSPPQPMVIPPPLHSVSPNVSPYWAIFYAINYSGIETNFSTVSPSIPKDVVRIVVGSAK